MVQLYQQQLATYEPGDSPSGFGFLAWEAAQMLIYALIESGHNPTRASVVKVFESLQNWNGGGALGGYTPSSHGVYTCDVDVQIKGIELRPQGAGVRDVLRRAGDAGLVEMSAILAVHRHRHLHRRPLRLAAMGMVLTYKTVGVFNFAYGAIAMFCAFTYWQLHDRGASPPGSPCPSSSWWWRR